MFASLLVSTPLAMTGIAVLLCFRFWPCVVNAALKSILKPVNSAPESFVVSKTLMPRRSIGRKYCIVIVRPFFQDDSAAAAAASASVGAGFGAGGSVAGADGVATAVPGTVGVSLGGCAAAGTVSASVIASARGSESLRVMMLSSSGMNAVV
jgi:hypothetical protein